MTLARDGPEEAKSMRKVVMRSAALAAAALVGCLHDARRPVVAPSATLGATREEAAAHLPTKLGVAFSGPTGPVASNEEAIVTVLFDRPMRTLDQPDDASALGATLTTKDGRKPQGRWRWVGAHGLVFEPETHLPHGSELEVVVPANVTSADGLRLGAEHRFTFNTAPPRVTYVSTANRHDLAPEQEIRVELDQPVDPAKLKASTHLIAIGATSTEAARSIAVNVRYATKVPKGRERAVIEITPADKLPLDRRIELVFDAGLVGLEGARGTAKEQRYSMRTYGPLALRDIVCAKATIGRCVASGTIDVELTNRVVPAELLSHLDVRGGEAARLLVEKSRSEPRTRLTIVRQSKPGKRYHVTVRRGLRDVFGQVLDHDLVFDVDTEDPFVDGAKKTPVATPTSTRTIEAPPPLAEPVGLAHRAKLDFEAEIGVRGHVVEALASSGLKSHVVPIGVVNVPTYGTFAASLLASDLTRWLDGTIAREGPTGGGWTWMWRAPGLPASTRAVTSIDLDALIGGPGKSGAAMLAMTVPGSFGAPTSSTLLDVTDLGVTARMSRHGGVVWVTKLSTGAPVPGAKVSIVRTRPKKDEQAIALDTATDDRGVATIPASAFDPIGAGIYGPAGDAYVLVHAGDDWTYQAIERGRASSQAWWDVDLDQRATMRGLLFTDRGVYRPGETAKLAGLARTLDGDAMKATPGMAVRVSASGEDGATLFDGRAIVDAFGTFTVDVPIPKTAKLGTVSMHAVLGNPADPTAHSVTLTTDAMLAAYKASAFQLDVALESETRQ
ncbi:MAG: MG2 domain-containing protein, partial [Polyangiales bacterium]